MNQNPLASPLAAESHESIVIGDESGAASDVVSMRPKKDASRTLPSLIGRNIQRSGHVRGGPPHRRGEVIRAPAAALVLRAEVGVAADLRVRDLRASQRK